MKRFDPDWLSPLGTDWCGESSLPCFTGGHVPGDFTPGEKEYLIGPADQPVRVRIVYRHLSGNSPLLGVVTLPDGRVTTDVWRRDGTHRSLNPMLSLRTKSKSVSFPAREAREGNPSARRLPREETL